ncbi:MAG: type VI secretion system baseplate subunit TssF [Saezia sp.]
MALKDIFREELNYLRKQGKEFASHNPKLARTLGEQATDPDVERLMEGFAFLTAKLRKKIEDDFPELTHGLIQLLWPNYLRPIPSATIVRFDPIEHAITEKQTIPVGTELLSVPVDGTTCRFRTCTNVNMYPLAIQAASDSHSKQESIVFIDLKTLSQQPLSTINCNDLTFHINSDDTTAMTLYFWLAKYLTSIRINIDGETKELHKGNISFPGFTSDEALLPYPRNVYDGYRILQEYFIFPQRFYFFTLQGLRSIWPQNNNDNNVQIEFHFSRPMPTDFRLRTADLSLYCTPAINLFTHDGEPITLTGKAINHRLEPSILNPQNYEIFSVDEVCSWKIHQDGGRGDFIREFHPFASFQHEVEYSRDRSALYYSLTIEEAVEDESLRYKVAFVRSDEVYYLGKNETVSIQMTCTNRQLPLALGIGDICIPTEETPSFATYKNITRPTEPCRPILDGTLHWTLISNMSLNYLSLLSADPMKAVIGAYDFSALYNIQHARATKKRLDSIENVETKPIDHIIKGFPVRGLKTTLSMNGDMFLCEGELYLFGTVLSHFFSLYPSINSFHQLEIINTSNREHYTWPIRNGKQPVI